MRGFAAAAWIGLAAACENEDHIPVELLRFITAYRQDLKMHVDVTPYARFLAHPEATFETMIDTWVGPDYSTFYYVYDDAENGQCDMKAESYGRGFGVTPRIALGETKCEAAHRVISLTSGVEGFDVGSVQAFKLRTEPVVGSKTLRMYVDQDHQIDMGKFNFWRVYQGKTDDVHKAFVWDQEKEGLGGEAPDQSYYQRFVKKTGGAKVEEVHFQSKKLETVPPHCSARREGTTDHGKGIGAVVITGLKATDLPCPGYMAFYTPKRPIRVDAWNRIPLPVEAQLGTVVSSSMTRDDGKSVVRIAWTPTEAGEMPCVGCNDGKKCAGGWDVTFVAPDAFDNARSFAHNISHGHARTHGTESLLVGRVEHFKKTANGLRLELASGHRLRHFGGYSMAQGDAKFIQLPADRNDTVEVHRNLKAHTSLEKTSSDHEHEHVQQHKKAKKKNNWGGWFGGSLLETEGHSHTAHHKPHHASPGEFILSNRKQKGKEGEQYVDDTEVRAKPVRTPEFVVVGHQVTGRLFLRTFTTPKIKSGEEAFVALTMTGHGFGAGDCGEYCQWRFTLKVNDEVAAVFLPGWKMCDLNPLDHQAGTWQEGRGTWCPGAAVHRKDGTFPITHILQRFQDQKEHHVEVLVESRGLPNADCDGVNPSPVGPFRAYMNNNSFVSNAPVTLQTSAQVHFYHKHPGTCDNKETVDGWYLQDGTTPYDKAPTINMTSEKDNKIFMHAQNRNAKSVMPESERQKLAKHVEEGKHVRLLLDIGAPPDGRERDHWDRFGSFMICLPKSVVGPNDGPISKKAMSLALHGRGFDPATGLVSKSVYDFEEPINTTTVQQHDVGADRNYFFNRLQLRKTTEHPHGFEIDPKAPFAPWDRGHALGRGGQMDIPLF